VGIVTGREALGMRVGFVGVGRMGQPVCANLVRAGYMVTAGTCELSLRAWWLGGGHGGAARLLRCGGGRSPDHLLPGTQELHDVTLVPGGALAALPRRPPGSI
jgi:hypothetical protein